MELFLPRNYTERRNKSKKGSTLSTHAKSTLARNPL